MVTKMKSKKIKKPRNQVGRRRYTLWHQHPYCYHCHRKLEWKKSTIDHLYSKVKNGRYKGKREKTVDDVDVYTVLSCSPCNHDQQKKERLEMPRWHWWIRSRAFPRITRKDLTMKEKIIILWYQWTLDYKPERI